MSNNTNVSNSTGVETIFSNVTWSAILLAVILYAVTVVTICGNILVLVAVKVNKRLQTNFNYYIVNLAVTDVAVAVTAMSFKATDTILGYWPFGEELCAMWIFFDYGMTFASVFTLILISVDRFYSVTWSIHYRQHHNRRNCLVAIGLVWVFMIILWFPPWLLDRLRYSEPGTCYWNPSLNKEFVFILAALGHHGPFLVLVFCYTYVFLFLRKHAIVNIAALDAPPRRKHIEAGPRSTTTTLDDTVTVTDYPTSINSSNHSRKNSKSRKGIDDVKDSRPYVINVQPSHRFLTVPGSSKQTGNHNQNKNKDDNSSDRRLRRERKIFITLSYITIAYIILWLPFHVVYDISIIDPGLVPEPILNIAFWLTYLNSTVNPLLYNFSNSEFRRTFKSILCRN